ncbi:MAG: amino acid ABC transporter substrate-binding protein [Pseudomonadota bacterium]
MRWIGALTAVLVVMPSAWAGAQTLDEIKNSGVLKVGYREDAAPYSYKNNIGEPDGYTVGLCKAVGSQIASQVGIAELSIEYVPVTTEDRFQAVQDGKIDLLCGATTTTLGRRELIDFSLPTFVDGTGVLLREDSPKTFGELAGHKVGVRAATTTEEALDKTLEREKIEATVVPVESHDEGLAKLEAGEVSAYFADQAILHFLLSKADAPDGMFLGDGQYTLEPYALALRRGDDDFRLAVDRALSRIYRSKEVDLIFKNSFGAKASKSELVQALYLINSLNE